ncbi:MAG: sugar ABC transporter permease [Spirochaetales bacterium]|nr:sugar ABC transporter permease [Spirochaetales bacterium]
MDRLKESFRHNLKQYTLLVALIVIVGFFEIATGGVLLLPQNVHNLINQNSYILILAVGMMLCILTGGNIDLSVGAVVAFVSASSALFCDTLKIPAPISLILGLLVGLAAGMWHGFWIAYVNIPSFIATLSGMLLFRGLNNIILQGLTVPLPKLYVVIAGGTLPDFIAGMGVKVGNFITGRGDLHLATIFLVFVAATALVFGMYLNRRNKIKYNFAIGSLNSFLAKAIAIFVVINLFGLWLSAANGLPYILIILTALILIYTFITQKTVIGRHIYAMGGNEKAAALSGVNTKKIMFLVYSNMGLLTAVAGIVFAGRLNAAAPTAGANFELEAIASCFVGGASMKGGEGTIVGAIIGGFIMGILNNGMSIMGVDSFARDVVKGLVLLIAVAFDVYSKSKSSTKIK